MQHTAKDLEAKGVDIKQALQPALLGQYEEARKLLEKETVDSGERKVVEAEAEAGPSTSVTEEVLQKSKGEGIKFLGV